MNDINKRFKELRSMCKKSQEDWGKIFGITKSGVSDIERGKRNVTKQHLVMLQNWKETQVNIHWLETGEGSPFLELPETDELAEYVEELLMNKDDSIYKAIRSFMLVYGRLDNTSKEVIRRSINSWFEELKKEQD